MTGASRTPATGMRPGGMGAPMEVVTVTPNPALDVAAALASAGHRVAATG
jgi:hypothetical protein